MSNNRRNFNAIGIIVIIGIIAAIIIATYLTLTSKTENETASDRPIENEYDLIVIGGEPEGVAAAVSAARNGAKTLLIEHRDSLGGLFTYGMLNFLDIPQGETGESVSKGIFQEWHQMVGGQSSFGIEEAKAAFLELVNNEPNLTLKTKTTVEEAHLDENKRITSITIKNADGTHVIQAKTFIDATQDADFAVLAGAPYFVGGEDIGIKDKKMSVTLMMHLTDVDWEGIKQTAQSEKFGPATVTDKVGWGFGELVRIYQPKEENTRLRGLNIAKINEDIYINALQIFGVDGLSPESKQEGIARGKREIENILEFLKKEFPGFENARIASFPSELYVRETRHIIAEYQLPMSDIWTNRDHWDNIAYGAYPVDIQAQTPDDYGYIVADPKQYAIPFRSLVPKEIDGLLIVGRSAGYSSIAAGSARVVPTGMATAEAAGAAAALTVKKNITFRELSKNEELIEELRTTLANQGAFVEHIETTYPYQGEWYDESIQTLLNYGLIFGRYDNDLKVDDPVMSHTFMNLIYNTIQRANPSWYADHHEEITALHEEILSSENKALTKEEATALLAQVSEELSNIGEEYRANDEFTQKEMYVIAANVLEIFRQK